MTDKFENVKVGDKLMRLTKVGINTWGGLVYSKDFYIEVQVQRVTKTQIVVEGIRYMKDGSLIGNRYIKNLFFKGEKLDRFPDELQIVPTDCQHKDALEYKKKLSQLVKNYEIDVLRKCENLEDALAVSDLIRQIESIVNNK